VLPLGELIEDINLYRCVNNDQIDNVDTDGRGIWNSTKKNILGPTVQCLKDSWGKISTVVGAACLVAPIYNGYKQMQAAMYGWNNYNTTVNMLNAKYGDPEDWPPSLSEYMNQWQSALLKQFGQAAAACYKATPGNPATGPVTSPVR
jgi:hypothetical protein